MNWKLTIAAALLLVQVAEARDVRVRGYFRNNGTYVQSHHRSSPDGMRWNNYSYPTSHAPPPIYSVGDGTAFDTPVFCLFVSCDKNGYYHGSRCLFSQCD